MICGAGYGQLPAIIKAKELGFEVVAVDKNPRAIGMAKADQKVEVDIVDSDAVLAVARELDIAGIMTMQSDVAVPTVGKVIQAMRLSGINYEVAQRCSDKIITRRTFREAGVPQPQFREISDPVGAREAALKIGYPCVIKAPDSSGSRGVIKVKRQADIEAAMTEAFKHTKSETLLLEEFIGGEEIGAQAFSVNGSCQLVLVHNDEVSPPPFMVPTGHSFPSKLSPDQIATIKEGVKAAVDALGINDGPSNIDLILEEDGAPRIIEIGARIGATCLPELVEYFTGIDWVRAAILSAVGESPDLTITKSDPCAAFILHSPADGVLNHIEVPEELKSKPGVLELEVTVRPGDAVSKLRKGTDRIGKVIACGSTVEDAEALAKMMQNSVVFRVEPT